MTIVMREIQLRLAAEAWLERASRRSAEQSPFRLSNPWLNCCLQADTLIDVACAPGWSLALIGNASEQTLGVERGIRSEAFSIKGLNVAMNRHFVQSAEQKCWRRAEPADANTEIGRPIPVEIHKADRAHIP